MRIKIFLLILLLSTTVFVDSFAQKMPLVYDVENTGADYPAPASSSLSELPVIQALPDPFMWADGRGRISNFSDWRYRRAEIGAQIQNYEIGEKPVRPDSIQASYSGGVLTVNVTVNGKTLTLTSQVILPAGAGPFPAVIGINFPSGSIPSTIFSSRNIAQITFSHNQVTTYGGPNKDTDPYYQLYPYLNPDNTGQYSAWAWGVSRIIDGLELVQNVLPIDLKHIAVTGCSYAGKLALFAGAFDERVALTIAQESGGGGATSWRYSHADTINVEKIDNTDYNWFINSMIQFAGNNVSKLPEDHHELMAMCAPRALYVTGNPDYLWLSNPSCYVCSKGCQTVYNTLGIADRFGYSIVGGHMHCQVPSSQIPEIEAFVNKFLLGNDTVNTNIATTPYNTDLSSWITWTTPTLSNDTSLIKWTSLRYPSDLETGLDTSITFKWNKMQDAEKYYIQVSLNPGFTNLDKSDSTTTDTVKTFTGLLKSKKYYWHVKVKSAAGVDLWSNTWSFITTTSLPAMPQLISATPKYPGRADVFTLTWRKVQDADQYLVHLSKVQTFTSDLRTGYPSDTVISFTALSKGIQYYWRIQASNFVGSGPWSDVWNFTTNVTGVKEEEGIPTEYSISQNYPNPFNPTTTILFSLPIKSYVSLKIFDLLGREVATIVSEEMLAGNYSRQWNANKLSSGLYFYQLRAGSFVETKKLLFLK
jgi:hypothetical protein